MKKDEMMPVVKEILLIRLADSDFGMQLCELVWDRLYPEGIVLSDEEDAVACKIFDECFDELCKKVIVCLGKE